MSYIDGFVIVVKKSKVADYKALASRAAGVWKKYGALDYKECVGNDLNPQMPDTPEMVAMGKPLTFPEMTKLGADETVIFSYIVFRDRAHRDEVNTKVMDDPFMKEHPSEPMPFEMSKMAYGGFEAIVE